MVQIDAHLSTGLPGLDKMFKGLIPGDNIVWQVDEVSNYRQFVVPFCHAAIKRGLRLVYFRFAKHKPLIPPDVEADVHVLDPKAGFENFILEIHKTIEANGRGGYYVFDCLTDLAEDWYSDQMLAAITGDAKWADHCEDVAFNSLPASMTPDLKGCIILLHRIWSSSTAQINPR
jgi:hypothetical protein